MTVVLLCNDLATVCSVKPGNSGLYMIFVEYEVNVCMPHTPYTKNEIWCNYSLIAIALRHSLREKL